KFIGNRRYRTSRIWIPATPGPAYRVRCRDQTGAVASALGSPAKSPVEMIGILTNLDAIVEARVLLRRSSLSAQAAVVADIPGAFAKLVGDVGRVRARRSRSTALAIAQDTGHNLRGSRPFRDDEPNASGLPSFGGTTAWPKNSLARRPSSRMATAASCSLTIKRSACSGGRASSLPIAIIVCLQVVRPAS